jgi:hypothetical protein
MNANQAKLVHQYINTRRRLLKTNAHIWFNRTCQIKHIVPKYAKINMKGTNKAVQQTQWQIRKLRISNEIKSLSTKKHKINV